MDPYPNNPKYDGLGSLIDVTATVGENIIGAPKIRNYCGAIQLLYFSILR